MSLIVTWYPEIGSPFVAGSVHETLICAEEPTAVAQNIDGDTPARGDRDRVVGRLGELVRRARGYSGSLPPALLRIEPGLIRNIAGGSMLPMRIDTAPEPLPLVYGPLRALFELFGTRPPGLPDALHTVAQLRRVALSAGLAPETGFDLDAYLAELRARLFGPGEQTEPGEAALPGKGTEPGEVALPGEETEPGEAALPGEETEPGEVREPEAAVSSEEAGCPAPVDSDIAAVAALRDRLQEALLLVDEARCAEGLNAASRESGLFPGVDGEGRLRVLAAGNDFVSRLAAVLIPAAMSLATPERRRRVRSCGSAACGILFFDRSRDGRGRYCSPTCSARARMRARRGRILAGD